MEEEAKELEKVMIKLQTQAEIKEGTIKYEEQHTHCHWSHVS